MATTACRASRPRPPRAATGTPGRSLTPTATPPPSYGATDLVLGDVSVTSEGHLRIVVENRGPGDVPGSTLAVQVSATGFSPELLGGSGILRAGATAVFHTSVTQLTATTT